MAHRVVGRTFWDFLYEAWPTERAWVTIAMFSLDIGLLNMAKADPKLWEVEVFKVIIQAVTLTGLLNMILAFHFTANKTDEVRSQNTGKALDAIKATADAAGGSDKAIKEATQDVVDGADAARDKVLGSQGKGGISSDEETSS